MAKPNFCSPLKIGFLVVASAYFLFTFHAMFTLSWIGEWDFFSGSLRLVIFAEDISASIGIVFRLAASAVALGGVLLYFAKKGISTQKAVKVLRLVLVGETLYWLGLLASAVLPLFSIVGFTVWRVDGHISSLPVLTSLLTNELPLLVESIAIPAVLLKLFYELNPNRPLKGAIKWGLIAGAAYIFVFWLNSTVIWVLTVMRQGIGYLLSYPQNLFSLIFVSAGLLALAVYSGYFAKRSLGTETLGVLKMKTVGGIITALGLFYLWNYLAWIFFGSDEIWSNWYAWFLGHNLNLWLLSLPLVGLPLLFEQKTA